MRDISHDSRTLRAQEAAATTSVCRNGCGRASLHQEKRQTLREMTEAMLIRAERELLDPRRMSPHREQHFLTRAVRDPNSVHNSSPTGQSVNLPPGMSF